MVEATQERFGLVMYRVTPLRAGGSPDCRPDISTTRLDREIWLV
jgi:hypothetical protein